MCGCRVILLACHILEVRLHDLVFPSGLKHSLSFSVCLSLSRTWTQNLTFLIPKQPLTQFHFAKMFEGFCLHPNVEQKQSLKPWKLLRNGISFLQPALVNIIIPILQGRKLKQRDEMTCPGPCSESVVELGSEFKTSLCSVVNLSYRAGYIEVVIATQRSHSHCDQDPVMFEKNNHIQTLCD